MTKVNVRCVTRKGGIAHAGDCTQLARDGINNSLASLNAVQEKPGFLKFPVEKRGGTPYRTRSCLRAAQPFKTEAAKKQDFPPRSWCGKSARNMLLV
jgi:hypothetical protein